MLSPFSHVKLCDPMDCSPPGSSVHGDSPGKNTRVGCHALFQSDAVERCNDFVEFPVRCVMPHHGVGNWGEKAANCGADEGSEEVVGLRECQTWKNQVVRLGF